MDKNPIRKHQHFSSLKRNAFTISLVAQVSLILLSLILYSVVASGEDSPSLVKGEMIAIPAGNFIPLYGSKSKVVHIENFQMQKYPVTLGEFEEFLKQNPKWTRNKAPKTFIDKSYLKAFNEKGILLPNTNSRSPVTHVSWYAANAYCRWLKLMLPTVNQWEYAASLPIPGHEVKKIILEWYSQPTPEQLPAVDSGFRNTSGVSCLHGLIWEWTLDFASTMISGENRGSDSLDKNMFCGSGSLGSADATDYAAFLRFGLRSSLKANFTLANLGFRCVKGDKKP